MTNKILINQTINPFNKTIEIEGDKSLSIRWALLASQSLGKSTSTNLLKSEDVLNTLNCLKKLGVKINLKKNKCIIHGVGINGFNNNKKNIILNAGNSGTLARLIMGLLVHTKNKIKLIGDKSLSKRDFERVINPLKKFGAKFKSNSGNLPLTITGTNNPKPIKFTENIGSAQCKSAIMLAALNTKGETIIKARKSRNHSELLYKYLNIPIKIKNKNKFDLIKINGGSDFKSFNYKIPSDISSAAFFIILTTLSKKSKLIIKNVNVNPTRTGILKILRIMGVNIILRKAKIYKGEKIADIHVKSTKKIKSINCPTNLNSFAIDEFLIIFLLAAKAKGISYFKNLSELNQKESPRLKWGAKILKLIGVKTIITKDSIKIFGNPAIKNKKKIVIKNYLGDHRVFMTSVIAGLVFGGKWSIYDKNSIKTSFPTFLKIINKIKK